MTELNEIFIKTIEYGKIVNKKNLDGLNAWIDIKPLFEKHIECGKWNIFIKIGKEFVSDINTIYDYVHDDLEMKGDENDDMSDKKMWEKKHFFLQLIKIIKNNPEFSFVRLMQIAYNIGQLSNHIEYDSLFTEEIREYFYSNKLNKISSYVDISKCEFDAEVLNDVLEKMNEKIEFIKELQDGRNDVYYKKYIKYKNKYLKLKSSNKK